MHVIVLIHVSFTSLLLPMCQAHACQGQDYFWCQQRHIFSNSSPHWLLPLLSISNSTLRQAPMFVFDETVLWKIFLNRRSMPYFFNMLNVIFSRKHHSVPCIILVTCFWICRSRSTSASKDQAIPAPLQMLYLVNSHSFFCSQVQANKYSTCACTNSKNCHRSCDGDKCTYVVLRKFI